MPDNNKIDGLEQYNFCDYPVRHSKGSILQSTIESRHAFALKADLLFVICWLLNLV